MMMMMMVVVMMMMMMSEVELKHRINDHYKICLKLKYGK